LHRALDGTGPEPIELWVSRMCDAFPSLSPSTLIREQALLPVGMLDGILEARAYARMHALWTAADTPAKRKALPQSALLDLVKANDLAIATEDIRGGR